MSGQNGLVPKQITRKDGVLTTVWVRPNGDLSASVAKAPTMPPSAASNKRTVSTVNLGEVECSATVDGKPTGPIVQMDYEITEDGREQVQFETEMGYHEVAELDWADEENFVLVRKTGQDLLSHVSNEDRDFIVAEVEQAIRDIAE